MSTSGPRRHPPRTAAEERFRRWAARPPATPPEEAARRVVERLEPRRRSLRSLWAGWDAADLRWAAAAAVLAAAATVAGLLWSPGSTPGPAASETPPLEQGVVLLWLDSQTPLYMTLTPPPPAAEKGDPS
jgi:hypothetical protein